MSYINFHITATYLNAGPTKIQSLQKPTRLGHLTSNGSCIMDSMIQPDKRSCDRKIILTGCNSNAHEADLKMAVPETAAIWQELLDYEFACFGKLDINDRVTIDEDFRICTDPEDNLMRLDQPRAAYWHPDWESDDMHAYIIGSKCKRYNTVYAESDNIDGLYNYYSSLMLRDPDAIARHIKCNGGTKQVGSNEIVILPGRTLHRSSFHMYKNTQPWRFARMSVCRNVPSKAMP